MRVNRLRLQDERIPNLAQQWRLHELRRALTVLAAVALAVTVCLRERMRMGDAMGREGDSLDLKGQKWNASNDKVCCNHTERKRHSHGMKFALCIVPGRRLATHIVGIKVRNAARD